MEPTESRYAHLLQPIRELTKNWEIDVASELNDYLEELDDMCITLDGGKTRLNFAEAALLIQGSTCIYSKKVELLHSLVYQTLEYISDRNKKRSKEAAAAQGGKSGTMQSSHDADSMTVFTPLDLEASETSQRSDSCSTVSVVPLPPESLIPPEPYEKQKLPLISVKGEVICSQKDFRINLFIPGERNLILLRSAAASRLLLDQHPADAAVQPQAVDCDVDVSADAAQNFLPEDEHMELDQNTERDPNPEEHIERHQVSGPSDGRMIRERRQRQQDKVPPAVNVWMLHDPYAVLGEDKPFKAGKCYKVPNGLDDVGKRKRKQAASLQDFRSWFRGTFDPPQQKLKAGPTFTDLNYIYLSTLKDKVKTQKRINRRAGVMMSEEELRRTFLQLEEAGPQLEGAGPVDEFRHADLLGGDDEHSDVENEAFPDDIPAEFIGAPDFISPEAQRDELTYEDLVKLRVEQLVVNSRGYTQETALSRRVKDWEDQIRPQLLLQEERPVFDIHDYGERIVGALSGVGCRRSFASIVHGLDNFEVCKYLLASLQLANDHTVEVDSTAGLEDSLDTMSLTLLSTHKATDRFKKLTASTSTRRGSDQ